MFLSGLKETQQNTITLSDIRYEVFEAILQYLVIWFLSLDCNHQLVH